MVVVVVVVVVPMLAVASMLAPLTVLAAAMLVVAVRAPMAVLGVVASNDTSTHQKQHVAACTGRVATSRVHLHVGKYYTPWSM